MNEEKGFDPAAANGVTLNDAVKISEAANRMGVSVALVRTWISDPAKRARFIPNAFKGGSGSKTSPWFFPVQDIERYLRLIRSGGFGDDLGDVAAA